MGLLLGQLVQRLNNAGVIPVCAAILGIISQQAKDVEPVLV